jgi:agmatine deiminase
MSSTRRFPAEWEQIDAVQLTLPHPGTDWASMLIEVMPCFIEIINTLTEYCHVLVVGDEDYLNSQDFGFTHPEKIIYAHLPTNDTWARDHSGLVIETGPNRFEILNFVFNGWGLKFPANHDNLITSRLSELSIFNATHKHAGLVLEGGGVESDGQGTLMTTSECLLSPNRNPHLSKKQIETKLKQLFGVQRILWVNNGYLAGDDTDSHIDTLARFCTPDTICYVKCTDPFDEHYQALEAMEAELQAFTQPNGKPYNLVALPMTDAIYDDEDHRLPATYANFLFANEAILLPIYDVPQDDEAIEIFKKLFPKHTIRPINCRSLIYQHGSLHCVTMQYPKGSINADVRG